MIKKILIATGVAAVVVIGMSLTHRSPTSVNVVSLRNSSRSASWPGQRGMRLFVTHPFTFTGDPMKSEYLAEVVRVDHLADSRFGIAVPPDHDGVTNAARPPFSSSAAQSPPK